MLSFHFQPTQTIKIIWMDTRFLLFVLNFQIMCHNFAIKLTWEKKGMAPITKYPVPGQEWSSWASILKKPHTSSWPLNFGSGTQTENDAQCLTYWSSSFSIKNNVPNQFSSCSKCLSYTLSFLNRPFHKSEEKHGSSPRTWYIFQIWMEFLTS